MPHMIGVYEYPFIYNPSTPSTLKKSYYCGKILIRGNIVKNVPL